MGRKGEPPFRTQQARSSCLRVVLAKRVSSGRRASVASVACGETASAAARRPAPPQLPVEWVAARGWQTRAVATLALMCCGTAQGEGGAKSESLGVGVGQS